MLHSKSLASEVPKRRLLLLLVCGDIIFRKFYIRISHKECDWSQAMSFISEGAVQAGNKIQDSGAVEPSHPVVLERHSLSRK